MKLTGTVVTWISMWRKPFPCSLVAKAADDILPSAIIQWKICPNLWKDVSKQVSSLSPSTLRGQSEQPSLPLSLWLFRCTHSFTWRYIVMADQTCRSPFLRFCIIPMGEAWSVEWPRSQDGQPLWTHRLFAPKAQSSTEDFRTMTNRLKEFPGQELSAGGHGEDPGKLKVKGADWTGLECSSTSRVENLSL